MSSPTHLINFVFGFRSPYAWLAHKFIDKHISEAEKKAIVYTPFWNPMPETVEKLESENSVFLYRDMSRQRHLYIMRDIQRLVIPFAEDIVWPVDRPDQNWELPHLLYIRAVESDMGYEALQSIFEARFNRGLDICDSKVLEGLANSLDIEQSSNVSEKDRLAPLHFASRNQVFGVPFFVANRQRFWGLDRMPFALRAAGISSSTFEAVWFSELVA